MGVGSHAYKPEIKRGLPGLGFPYSIGFCGAAAFDILLNADIPDREGELLGRAALDRKRHHPFSHDLLADFLNGSGSAFFKAAHFSISLQKPRMSLKSFMPETVEKILAQLNAEEIPYEEFSSFAHYKSGSKVTEKSEILFARLDLEEVLKKVEERYPSVPEETAEEEAVIDLEPKGEITFDDFIKIQFQVGEIIECKAVEKSKKLLCSQVKIKSQVKQIVSGIRKHYAPEDMVSKKVMVPDKEMPAGRRSATQRNTNCSLNGCKRTVSVF